MDVRWFPIVLLLGAVSSQDTEEDKPVYKKPEVYSLTILSDIKYRYATTLVTSRVKNPDTVVREAIFDVTLPEEAFITNLTIEEDGKIIVGEIKKKEEAKRQYEAAQSRGESAGYIGTKHRETNQFNLAITVAPLSKVSFNLTYQELLKRKLGHYEQVIYIDPGQPVPEMDITVKILESRNITSLKVPPLRNDVGTNLLVLDSLTFINQPTPKSALVKFVPSMEEQKAQKDSGMAGQFVVQYDVERGMDAGDVMVVNGYFVHFFAPEGLEPIPNDVLFILDVSGSMAGTKLGQLKAAMHGILKDMNEGDRINIMTFSGETLLWQRRMMDITDEENLEDAKEFVQQIHARGSTDINKALTGGIEFMNKVWDRDPKVRSPVIVFLTDGQATSGITNDKDIMDNIRSANSDKEISIFSLAFGHGADYDLIKKIAIQNNGFGKRIYQASDAAMQIAGFYNEISMTILKNLSFHYLDAPVSKLTKHHYETYFNGTEMIICGMLDDDYQNENTTDNTLQARVESKGFKGPTVLVSTNLIEPEFGDAENLTQLGDYEKITEKVWAYLTIKQLLDEKLASSNTTEQLALTRRILDLSLQYGFVTPVTSMVVTKKQENNTADPDPEIEVVPVSVDPAGALRPGPSPGRGPAMYGSSNVVSKSVGSSGMLARMPVRPSYMYGGGRPGLGPRGTSPGRRRPPPKASGSGFLHSPVMHYDSDADSSPSKDLSRRRVNRIKHKKQKAKKNSKRLTAYPMPLKVSLKDIAVPVCFALYSDKMIDGRMYKLYAENGPDGDFQIFVNLKAKKVKKRQSIGWIHKVVIRSDNGTQTINSSGSDNVMTFDQLQGLNLTLNIKDSSLNIAVYSVNYDKVSTDGILGSILSKKIKEKTRKKGKTPKKNTALLKVDKKVVKMVLQKTAPFFAFDGSSPDECLMSRKEQDFYDLAMFES